jgi:hypothetical protein
MKGPGVSHEIDVHGTLPVVVFYAYSITFKGENMDKNG